jgi:hypothetical protein
MVHEWLSDETNGRWTMLVDNADDAAVIFKTWNEEMNTTTVVTSTAHSLSEYSGYRSGTPSLGGWDIFRAPR